MHYERGPASARSKLAVGAPPPLRCAVQGLRSAAAALGDGAEWWVRRKTAAGSLGKSAGEWQFTLRGKQVLARNGEAGMTIAELKMAEGDPRQGELTGAAAGSFAGSVIMPEVGVALCLFGFWHRYRRTCPRSACNLFRHCRWRDRQADRWGVGKQAGLSSAGRIVAAILGSSSLLVQVDQSKR
jgi:hypothetical protein